MITKKPDLREQIHMISMDELVPQDHLLRKVDKYIDFTFIYGLVEEKYSRETGRPSIDPVILIKIPLIQYMFGIKSMRQTIKEIEVNVAYRWFLGLNFYDKVPHFTTFGKNYKRRFDGTDLFEQIFMNILMQCMKHGFVDTKTLYVDATHIKAHANNKKLKRAIVAKKVARYYDEALRDEIDKDRENHGKKPLKDKPKKSDESDETRNTKEIKVSTTDPESGWFHKGEHKQVFAYTSQVACDKHGWVLGYTVHPGNEHDSITFPKIYEKLIGFNPDMIVMDSGYKTPAIAKMLIDDGIKPVFPYKRPMTKRGFFKKYEYAYDSYYDCVICPNNKILKYCTTDRNGYRDYKSNPNDCTSCPYLNQCSHSANHTKVIKRHVWEDYMEICEDIRYTRGMKEIYSLRKETIERLFGTAKEHHQMRYTNQIGKRKMSMKVGLTLTCLNIKKLINLLGRIPSNTRFFSLFMSNFSRTISFSV